MDIKVIESKCIIVDDRFVVVSKVSVGLTFLTLIDGELFAGEYDDLILDYESIVEPTDSDDMIRVEFALMISQGLAALLVLRRHMDLRRDRIITEVAHEDLQVALIDGRLSPHTYNELRATCA